MLVRLSLINLFLCSLSSWAMADYSQQLNSVKTEIKFLDEGLSKSKDSKETLYKQLKQQSYTISQLNNLVFNLKKQLQQGARKLAILSEMKFEQQNFHKQQIDVLLSQVRAAYIKFQNSDIKILLNKNNPAELARIMTYYRYIHQARKRRLVELKDSLKILTQEYNSLFAVQKYRQQLHRQEQKKQQILLSKTRRSQDTLILLEKEILAKDSELKLLKIEKRYLHGLLPPINKFVPKIENLRQRIISEYKPFHTRLGLLTWPVKGELLARYGKNRNIGKLTWQGIIIATSTGDNIVASAPGRVVFANWLKGFGLLIIVDHGDQYMTLYGNNKTLFKEVGEDVSTDELIAQSGIRGMHEYSGLYFEMRHKGKPINPLKWLKKIS